MKYFIFILLTSFLSCAPQLQVEKYSTVNVTTFARESYLEAVAKYNTFSPCQKELASYFERRIFETYIGYKWMSCGKNLNSDERHYMAKWWAVQGITKVKQEIQESECVTYLLLVKCGTDKKEVKEFIYAVTYKYYFDQYTFDVCAYNKDIHRF